ncbi:hypothetical protein KPH14_012839, partial [Odynerus spinipes]
MVVAPISATKSPTVPDKDTGSALNGGLLEHIKMAQVLAQLELIQKERKTERGRHPPEYGRLYQQRNGAANASYLLTVGKKSTTIRKVLLKLTIDTVEIESEFLVVPGLCENVIVGHEWFRDNKVLLDYAKEAVVISGKEIMRDWVSFRGSSSLRLIIVYSENDEVKENEVDESEITKKEEVVLRNMSSFDSNEDRGREDMNFEADVEVIANELCRFDLKKFIQSHNIDLALLSETKLNKKNKLHFNNYGVLRTDRPNAKMGGGIAILAHKRLDCTASRHPNSMNNQTIEYSAIKLK